ncbi:MAG: hypothetical protein ACI8ZB_001972 [Desulforhopalus sp.]|jgi:hypothetical protein
MKYIITIVGIIWTATLVTLYFVWPDQPIESNNIAATVNGHDLAKNVVTSQGAKVGYHSEDYPELLDSAITRELLIQEAQRQNIDQEESFRLSLKTFYEESLIKTLMDRQYDKPALAMTEAEIDVYLSFYGKIVTFTRLQVSASNSETIVSDQGSQNEVLFDDLAESMKVLLAGLKPGEHTIKFDTGTERYAIRLDKVDASENVQIEKPDHEHARQILEGYKQQQQIDNWLHELRNKASIKINNG